MNYDVIVIGTGHAGCEAALATARMGLKTLMLTISVDAIARMSCNPAIGGLAKGQLVREIDALGGEMAKATDATGIQFRMLNTSKGPAVRSPRAQCDKQAYYKYMRQVLESTSNLIIKENTIDEIIIPSSCHSRAGGNLDSCLRRNDTQNKNDLIGVKGKNTYYARAVILTPGTFMNGVIHIGKDVSVGGRIGEPSAEYISGCLGKLGLEIGRLKTGTPPRLHKDSIDFSQLRIQDGDNPPVPFSFTTKAIKCRQIPCYITHTNARTHQIINDNLDRSPLYSGQIKAVGPKYCPSIEDKVVRFAAQPLHQIFLEPEGIDVPEIYCNGISTSLPKDVQGAMVHSIKGLEKAEFIRYGYAIEYDFVLPYQIKPTLETKKIEGLFLAGQINGTSGYEEAAAQGIMAGINAALKIQGKEPFVLNRDEAYIGVLIDDLVTLGPTEPYRMFTSRAEYRLLLRSDNADRRLMPYGAKFGLIGNKQFKALREKEQLIEQAEKELHKKFHQHKSLWELLKRSGMTIDKLPALPKSISSLPADVREQAEIDSKYEGYIRKQLAQIERSRKMEGHKLPDGIDYAGIRHLSNEARTKLTKFRPATLGQASRIAGVSPADITVLIIHLKAGFRD